MTNDVDNLLRRLAALLTDIEGMESAKLDPLANSPLPKGATSGEDTARKLLRGLLRSRNLGFRDLRINGTTTEGTTIVPALPGLDVIHLLPLSNGSFDRQHVLKTPVVAWKIDLGGYAEPIVPGMPVTCCWAVLTPQGYVITDQYTNLFGEYPLQLNDWIKSEIEWLEYLSGGSVREFPTAFTRMLKYGGPIAKAIGLLMAGRPDWIGTSEELWTALAEVDDEIFVTFTASLKELAPKLAGLSLRWLDDGQSLLTVWAEKARKRTDLPSRAGRGPQGRGIARSPARWSLEQSPANSLSQCLACRCKRNASSWVSYGPCSAVRLVRRVRLFWTPSPRIFYCASRRRL